MQAPPGVDQQKTITSDAASSDGSESKKETAAGEKTVPGGDLLLKDVAVKKSAAVKADQTTFEGRKYRAIFSSRGGGGLESLEL